MDMFKEAESLACMLEKRKLKQRELAESLGVSPSYIANKLRLLNYSAEMRKIITDSGLSERHARALLRLDSEEDRLKILERIKAEGLSVYVTEALVDGMRAPMATLKARRLTRTHAVSGFLDGVKESVTHLRSLGIEARHTESYHGTKLYVTISIDESCD